MTPAWLVMAGRWGHVAATATDTLVVFGLP